MFRNLFPPSAIKVNVSEFFAVCVSDEVVQNCFHSATYCVDKIFSAIIALYFKVRVHAKCKVLLEKLRSKKHDSKKEKALRSKLAK